MPRALLTAYPAGNLDVEPVFTGFGHGSVFARDRPLRVGRRKNTTSRPTEHYSMNTGFELRRALKTGVPQARPKLQQEAAKAACTQTIRPPQHTAAAYLEVTVFDSLP